MDIGDYYKAEADRAKKFLDYVYPANIFVTAFTRDQIAWMIGVYAVDRDAGEPCLPGDCTCIAHHKLNCPACK